jgi:hypothetical protein
MSAASTNPDPSIKRSRSGPGRPMPPGLARAANGASGLNAFSSLFIERAAANPKCGLVQLQVTLRTHFVMAAATHCFVGCAIAEMVAGLGSPKGSSPQVRASTY